MVAMREDRVDAAGLRVRDRHIRALLALMVLVNLAWSLYQMPLFRVLERRLCRDYYDSDGEIPEANCKVRVVQKGIGTTHGIMETIWVVGGAQPPPPPLVWAARSSAG